MGGPHHDSNPKTIVTARKIMCKITQIVSTSHWFGQVSGHPYRCTRREAWWQVCGALVPAVREQTVARATHSHTLVISRARHFPHGCSRRVRGPAKWALDENHPTK